MLKNTNKTVSVCPISVLQGDISIVCMCGYKNTSCQWQAYDNESVLPYGSVYFLYALQSVCVIERQTGEKNEDKSVHLVTRPTLAVKKKKKNHLGDRKKVEVKNE